MEAQVAPEMSTHEVNSNDIEAILMSRVFSWLIFSCLLWFVVKYEINLFSEDVRNLVVIHARKCILID